MAGMFDEGLVATILDQFSPSIRPLVDFGLVAVVIGAAIATALNPILELIHRVWLFLRWVARATKESLRKVLGKTPPEISLPNPSRQIPEERTIWESRAPTNPTFPNTNGIPIIAIANMKGGVGKTTIAANLAVYLRDELKKPILLIDFDYQGSLTQSIRGEAGYTEPDLTADVLISPNISPSDAPLYAREMRRGLENIFLYPTSYPFATIENNLMASWLNGDGADLMYRLCSILKLPAFQEKYGAVIIDCPPRLTTGSINALCASTHLIVPTTLDDLSAQAAEYFLGQVLRMSSTVFPKLKVIGIVPSIIYGDGTFLVGERATLSRLTQYGRAFWRRDDFVLLDGRVPRLADISNFAGVGVASLRKTKARMIFDRLGAEVAKRLK